MKITLYGPEVNQYLDLSLGDDGALWYTECPSFYLAYKVEKAGAVEWIVLQEPTAPNAWDPEEYTGPANVWSAGGFLTIEGDSMGVVHAAYVIASKAARQNWAVAVS